MYNKVKRKLNNRKSIHNQSFVMKKGKTNLFGKIYSFTLLMGLIYFEGFMIFFLGYDYGILVSNLNR